MAGARREAEGRDDVVVPELIGMHWRRAREAADRADLLPTAGDPDRAPLSESGWPGGVVAGQEPAPGARVPRGTQVRLVFTRSSGPEGAGVREPRRPIRPQGSLRAEAHPDELPDS